MTSRKSTSKPRGANPRLAKPRPAKAPATRAKAHAAKQAAPAKKPAARKKSAEFRKKTAAKPAPPRKPAPSRKPAVKSVKASPARPTKTVAKPSKIAASRPKPKPARKTPSHVTTPALPKTTAPAPEKTTPVKPAAKPRPAKPGDSTPFTREEIAGFHAAMLELRKRLLSQVSELRQQSLLRHDEVNQDEDGTDAFERVTSLDRASADQGEILQIDNALVAIQEGTYGLCEICGCKIEKTRLKALPFAKTCIRCQSTMENANSRRRSTHDLWD